MVRDGAEAPLLTMRVRHSVLPRRGKSPRFSCACASPALASTLPANEPERAPADRCVLRKWEEINRETRLYPANDELQSQSGRRTQRFADVGRGPSAVRARQEVHPRDRRPDVGRVHKARREEDRSLEFYTRTAGMPSEGQGQGERSRAVELLPARRRDRPGPEEPRL